MKKKSRSINITEQQSVNTNDLEGKYLSEKEEKTKDTTEVLLWPRSSEARKLAEASNWKIILRPDWKIDFPELGIIGMWRLSVEWPTDLENWLVQGDYGDQYDERWVPWISYMTWERAMKEVENQGKVLLPANKVEEIMQELMSILWNNQQERCKALQSLFWCLDTRCWLQWRNGWFVWSNVSYYGVSEVKDEMVMQIEYSELRWGHRWTKADILHSFLVCESFKYQWASS